MMNRGLIIGTSFIIVLLCISLIAFRYRIIGPELIVDNLPAQTSSTTVMLGLRTNNVSLLTVNGSQVIPDFDTFSEITIALNEGINVITLYAEDRYGKSVQKQYTVLRQ